MIDNKKKKILIYAHYYVPDTASTGQILQELAEGLLSEFEVTVICVVPSYLGFISDEYKKKKYFFEELNGVNIVRVRVPKFSKSKKISRVKNIICYFIRAMIAIFKVGRQDYIFSISQPPILGGLLGVWGKWIKKAKFIYNIQDFNPEQTIAVGYSKSKFITSCMMIMDKFSCKRANKVIVVGRDMQETLKERFKNKKVPNNTFINNWIDEKEIYPLTTHSKIVEFKKKYDLNDKFIIMYSGNIGLYYDLENIIKVIGNIPIDLKTKNGQSVIFAFIGDGSLLEKMKTYVMDYNLSNVTFIPYQEKEDLVYSLNSGDVHWCVNSKGIKGVSVPSKCYGIMSAAKPVLGVLEEESEARMLIEETNCGVCCEPGDYQGIENMIFDIISNYSTEKLTELGNNGRKYLVDNLTKDISIDKYTKEILSS